MIKTTVNKNCRNKHSYNAKISLLMVRSVITFTRSTMISFSCQRNLSKVSSPLKEQRIVRFDYLSTIFVVA